MLQLNPSCARAVYREAFVGVGLDCAGSPLVPVVVGLGAQSLIPPTPGLAAPRPTALRRAGILRTSSGVTHLRNRKKTHPPIGELSAHANVSSA